MIQSKNTDTFDKIMNIISADKGWEMFEVSYCCSNNWDNVIQENWCGNKDIEVSIYNHCHLDTPEQISLCIAL